MPAPPISIETCGLVDIVLPDIPETAYAEGSGVETVFAGISTATIPLLLLLISSV